MKFACNECSKVYASQFSLKRHLRTMHHSTVDNASEMGSDESNHMSLDDSNEETDSTWSPASSDEENSNPKEATKTDSLMQEMISRAYAIHRDAKEQMMSELTSEGISRDDASERVHAHLLPKYQKSLRNIFRQEMLRLQKMRKHPVYKAVMLKVHDLEDEGFDREEAISSALSHRKYLLYKMIPSDPDSDGSDMETEGED